MKISTAGINLIKQFEGCKLTAYKAVATEKYYTIGYGHYGSDVTKGMTITQAKATSLLKTDLAKFENLVEKYDDIYGFNQNEFDALVSFAYNIGNIDQLTRDGCRTRDQIAEAMVKYNKSGGKVLAGLTKRRKAEQELFLKACATKSTKTTLKSVEVVAQEVLEGKWGNGADRKKNLESAGYDYLTVQKKVNALLRM